MKPIQKPGKSFLLTAGLAIVAAAAPFVNDAAERCCGVQVTETELQHLLYAFLGSAGVGGAVGIHKRHVGARPGNGTAHDAPGNGGAILTEVLAALLHANPPQGGAAGRANDDLTEEPNDSDEAAVGRAMADLSVDDDNPDVDSEPPGRG